MVLLEMLLIGIVIGVINYTILGSLRTVLSEKYEELLVTLIGINLGYLVAAITATGFCFALKLFFGIIL